MIRGRNARSRTAKSIIVTFVRRDVRDNFFEAKKQLFDFTSRDLVFQRVAEQKIFIAHRVFKSERLGLE